MGKVDLTVATLLRRKAEKLLKTRPEHDEHRPTEGEILKLLHELEVYNVELELQNDELIDANIDAEEINKKHIFSDTVKQRIIHEFELNQIELEMQNEELLLANVISQDVAERYSDLFNFSSSGYLILSQNGEIIDLNYTGARILGKERLNLKNSMFGFFVLDESKSIYNIFLESIFKNKSKNTCEVILTPNDSLPIDVLLTGILTQNGEQCLMTMLNITERKQTNKYRSLTREILQIINDPGDIHDTLHRTLTELKLKTGFDAVGIRLQEGNDYPYTDHSGFSSDFLLTENTLIELDSKGKICRDKNGNDMLACTCGLIISGSINTTDHNVTQGGSWWTENSHRKPVGQSDEDDRSNTRKQCALHGYESVALIPIRNNDKIVGLIQFNDHRKDVFNSNNVEFLEGIALYIGTALMRKQVEERLRKNEELLRSITENAPEIIIQLNRQGTIMYMNRSLPGNMPKDCIGKNFCEWTLPEYHETMNHSLKLVFEQSVSQTFISKSKDLYGEIQWYRTSISPVIDGEKVKNAIMITRDITESILNDEILRESEARRNAIIDTAMDGFWITDRRGCFLEVNNTYCRMSGYSRPELLTMRIHDVDVYENSKEVDFQLKRIAELGEDRFETRHRRKDGIIIDIEASVQYRQVDGGQYLIYLHNISKRKEQEKVLFESNEHFRSLFENSSDAILFTNPDGTIYSVNPAAEKMLGRSKEEIILLKRNEILDKNDPRSITALEERRKTGSFKGELNFLHKDGTIFPIEMTCTIFKDSIGIERSSIIARDITKRKKAEESVRINSLRLNLAMSVANMAWWEMNIQTGNITFEKRKAEMLGYLPENFKHYTDFMKLVHPDDAKLAMESMRNHIHGSSEKYETEYRILAKSGDYKWFYDIGSVTTRDSNGKSEIVTGLVLDITERKKAEESLHQSEERYKSLFQDNHSVMLMINPETGAIIDANQIACSYYGWSNSELCAKNIAEINSLTNEEITTEMLSAKKENRNYFYFKHRLATNEIRDVEVYSGPIQFGEKTMLYSLIHDVTDRRKAEKELEISKDNLRAILDATKESIYLFDKQGMIVDANITAAYRLKRDLTELKGRNILTFFDANILASRMSHLDEAFDSGNTVQFEDRRDEFIFEHNFFPVFNNGKVENVVSFSRDVTQSRKLEDSLKESEKKYRELVKYAPTGIFEVDLITQKFLTANDVLVKITGYSFKELISMNVIDLMDDESKLTFIDRMERMLKGEMLNDSFEYRFKAKDHHLINIILDNKFIFDDEGMPIGATFICHDITERVEMENALRESERKLSEIYSSMSEGLAVHELIFDSSGKAVDYILKEINPAYERITGINRNVISNRKATDIYSTKAPPYLDIYAQVESAGLSMSFETYSSELNKYINISAFSPGKGTFVTVFRDITAQKNAQKALLDSERRLDAVFNGVTETIMMMSVEGIILGANQTAALRWGLLSDELIGKDWLSLLPDEKKTKCRLQINEMIATESSIRFEDVREDRIYDLTFYPIKEISGEINQFVMFSTDITESKRAREALLLSEERYSTIYKSSRDGVFSMDLSGILTGANSSFCKEINLELSQIIGFTFPDIGLPGFLSSELNHLMKEVSETNNSIISEIKIPLSDGSVRFYETIFNPLHDNDDHVVGFGGSIRNITKRKEANLALIESEKRFRYLIKDMPVGVVLFGPDSKIIMSNPKAVELLGISEEQLMGNTSFDTGWNMIHIDGSSFIKSDREVDTVYEALQSNHDVEFGISRKNSNVVTWLLKNAEVILKSDGSIRNVVCSIIDITERKEKEEALRKLNMTLSALGKSSQAMSQPFEEVEYLKKVCNIIVEETDFEMAWIGYAEYNEEKSIRPMAFAGFDDNYFDTLKLSWDDNEFGRGPTGVAIRTGQSGICNNILTYSNSKRWQEKALKLGYGSSIVFPLVTGDFTFGALTIYSKKPYSFLDDEIKLLSKLSSDLAHGITTIRLLAAHQRAEKALIESHNDLEAQVKDRTAELLKTNDALIVTEEKYRTVADFATNWEFWLDQNDQMIYCSPSCERITGYTSSDFDVNSHLIYDIIHPDDLKIYQEHRENEKSAIKCDHEIQYRIYRKDGSIRWIGHYCRPVYNASGTFKGTRGSNKDITARKKMEELLKTSNKKYKMLSENINDGIFICKNARFEYFNSAFYTIFGYSEKELARMKLTQLVLTDYHEELENFLYTTAKINQSRIFEVECLRNDFTVVSVEILLNYVAADNKIYGVVHDITEKKEFQKNMVKAIIQTEEKERSHFSKELHDGLGPLLSTIKLYLQWSERPNSNKSRDEIIAKAGEILEEALTTVKEISTKLSPHLLTNYGLSSAIKSFVEKLNETDKYNIIFESNTSRRIDGDIETALYRAIIECINNTLKYAHASIIHIQIKDTGSQIQLQYKDNGSGFDINEKIAEHTGLGLFNLQNRLHTIGGKVDLYSEPGKGVDYLFTVNI